MLTWLDVLKFANHGNPAPDRRVEKTDEEWKAILTPEEYRVARKKGTEPAHSSEMCQLFSAGKYACVCCGTELFDSEEKFDSGTGWPSFTQPLKENAIAYHKDTSFGMYRVEAVCNTCDAHLGHVFQDGPPPSGLRFCMNAVSLKKVEKTLYKATFGGGCFWCSEAIFERLEGITEVKSGYSGGLTKNPTYREVCSGLTEHAEVIEVTYDPKKISYADIIRIHLTTHDPTTLNQQGHDKGTQYRSIILFRNEEERDIAMKMIEEVQASFDDMIVTELKMFEAFYEAERHHQGYYNRYTTRPYCQAVIDPKLNKFKALYKDKLKKE